jgi:MFS family permease
MVFQFPPTSAILADSIEPKNRGVGIATMNTLATAFSIFSPYVAGLIIEFYGDNFGIRILYLFLVVVQIFGAILVFKYLQETYTPELKEPSFNPATILREAYGGVPELVRNLPKSVKALAVLLGMGFIANGISSPFWVVYTTEVIGLSKINWGLILLLESILKTLLTIPFGIIADRYSRTKILLVAILFSLISIPTIIFAKNFVHVLLIRFGVGLAGSLLMPTSVALMADYIPREMRGRVMAAIGRGAFMVGAAGGGTGGPGMGYIFTLPVMASSIIGGILYTLNPIYPWIVVLVTIIIQLLTLIFFIRDPVKVER